MAVTESRTKRERTICVSLRETLCVQFCKPVQAESEIASAKGRVKPLARLLRCATALRVVQCYRTISNEIQNHWLICIPLFPS